ncbi:MAG: DUF1924 domain-containing protein [Burkholderiales bacterium]
MVRFMGNRRFAHIALLVLLACLASAAQAETDFGNLYRLYSQAGARDFSPGRGKDFWLKERAGEGGEPMNCVTCHGADLRKQGRHNKSGKAIGPMAPSVNKDRYTDVEKVEKWFLRNCKQVLRRECTPQEKGDVLRYLSQS